MTSPLAPPPPTGQPIDRWLYLLWKRIEAAVAAASGAWASLDFTGSDINDILTRKHEDLQDLNTTTYTHMTSAEHTGTGSGVFVRKTGATVQEVIVEASGSTDAIRVTNTGTGNSFVVEDSSNPDSSPFVIAADGNVTLGYTSGLYKFNLRGQGYVEQVIDSISGSYLHLQRAATSLGSPSILSSGNLVGQIDFYGYDGTAYLVTAAIAARINGTPGTNDMPGRLEFTTTADGAATPVERMRVSDGGVKASANLIVADGYVIIKDQPTPAQKSSTGTLTAANILTGIINADGASSYTLTLDTGTNFEAGITSWPTDGAVDWAVVYTGGTEDFLTIAGNTGHTIVGAATIVEGGSAMFRTRKTATNTFVTYRLT